MEAKLFTLDEATLLLPQLEPLVKDLTDAAGRFRDAKARLDALVEDRGEDHLDSPDNPGRAGYWRLVGEVRAHEERVQELVDEVRFRGVEVKDLHMGLLDFRTKRGGEVVYLCWRLGEPRIEYWHDLTSGFAGRRPLEEPEPRRV